MWKEMTIKKLRYIYRSRRHLISFMRDVTMQYEQNIRRNTGRTLSVRLRRMTSSLWNDTRYMFATIVATMLTMLYVAVNFLLIILETTGMLLMTLRNISRSKQHDSTTQ